MHSLSMALRADMEGAPRRRSGEGVRRAANRLRSHSKIATAGEREARGGPCYTRPSDEDAIYQSRLKLKRGRGGWEDHRMCLAAHLICAAVENALARRCIRLATVNETT